MNIPNHVIDTVSMLLKPYGYSFHDMLNGSISAHAEFLTAQQASDYCGLTPKTLRVKASQGIIKSTRSGVGDKTRVLISKSSLDKWLNDNSKKHRKIKKN